MTGVQTCALPILERAGGEEPRGQAGGGEGGEVARRNGGLEVDPPPTAQRTGGGDACAQKRDRGDEPGEDPGSPGCRHQHVQEDEPADRAVHDDADIHFRERREGHLPVPDDGEGDRDEEGGEGAQEEARGGGPPAGGVLSLT